jgi:hypothetical protein
VLITVSMDEHIMGAKNKPTHHTAARAAKL